MNINYLLENTQLTLQEIANKLGLTYKKVYGVWKKYPKEFRQTRKKANYRSSKLGDLNPMKGLKKEQHPNYKGIVSDNKGYLIQLKPDWYIGRKRSKHVFVHSITVCIGLGLSEIPRGFVVHHCDYNPHNNVFSNLVMLTNAEHSALHAWLLKGATTISKESTLKWVEARRADKSAMI